MGSVQSKIAHGAAWMTGLMVADRSLGFISTLILARLLVPADFGIVAMCTSVVAFFRIFLGFGFDMVLIQRQAEATRAHYDTVWTLRLAFSGLVAGGIGIAAQPASAYYGQPEIVLPMQVLAFSFLLRGLENIKVIDFRKELRFQKEVVFQVGQKFTGLAVSLPLAWYLESYWALIWGMVATNVGAVLLSYVMKPYIPHPTVSQRRDVFGFSAWMFMGNCLRIVWQRGSHYILGRGGPDLLGYFQIAQELTNVTAQVVASINRAVFPGYSKMAADLEQFRATYSRVISATAVMAMPAGLGIATIAPMFVPVALGEEWIAAAAPMQLLAICGILRALASNTEYVFYAKNKPHLVTYIQVAQAASLLPLLIFLIARFGMMGAAWSFVIVAAINLPVVFWLVSRELRAGPMVMFAGVWRPMLASIGMSFIVHFYMQEVPSQTALNLLFAMGIGAASYTFFLLLFLWIGPRSSHSIEMLLLRHFVRPLLR